MPLHDWSAQPAGNFHAFHNSWISELQKALNRGRLPPGFMPLGEQLIGDFGPDVLTLLNSDTTDQPVQGGILLKERPPKVRHRFEVQSESSWYAAKRRTVVIRHATNHAIVAVIEIVSPGNKRGKLAVQTFLNKLAVMIAQGIHVLLIDPFAAGKHDPQGLHRLLWEQIAGEDSGVDIQSSLVASYQASPPTAAFVEPLCFGQTFPDMPLFLTPDVYVDVPLEETYSAAWDGMPGEIQQQAQSS